MKKIAIIQTSMNSAKLPGKALKKLSNQTVLAQVIKRVLACPRIDEIVVATTTLTEDDCIIKEAEKLGIKWFRGNENNFLETYYVIAQKYQAEALIRITDDCPLLDIEILEDIVSFFQEESEMGLKIDYASNIVRPSFPLGLDAEIFTFANLEIAYNHATKDHEKAQVTPYIYEHPEKFSLHNLSYDDDLSHYRWLLETPEDYELIKIFYDNLYDKNSLFGMDDILELLEKNPKIAQINNFHRQNQVRE
jgi:spore coat polysaccharide biosynthesis protein SpsF